MWVFRLLNQLYKKSFKEAGVFMNNYKKTFFVTFFFIICSAFVMADIVWEGTAAMARYGEFPLKGFYGASNSFPLNTIILVENAKNKNSIEVLIVDNLSDNNLFLLLSKDAAEKLDMKQDEVLPVKAQILKEIVSSGIINTDDKKALNSDPDNNIAESGAPILANVAELENVLSENNIAPDKSAETSAGMAETGTSEKVVIIYDNEEDNIAETSDTESVLPPVPAETGLAAVEEAGDTPPYTDTDSSTLAENYKPSDTSASDDSQLMKNNSLSDLEEYYENMDKKYVLLPTNPRPPIVNGIDETASSGLVKDDTPVTAPAKSYAEKFDESYYVQIIAFKDYSSAEKVMKSVNIDYPLVIHYDEKQCLYKVMAGPLKIDERGAALYSARNSGYKDAFIKKGE